MTFASIRARSELHYVDGPVADRSPHVRAGSGLAWLRTAAGLRLVVAQDDTSFLALVDPAGGDARALALDHVVGGRRIFESRLGNKKHKLDLEAATSLPDGRVLVVGSGSLPVRERVVLVDASGARVVPLPAFYAALRAEPRFAGSELNVEGAAVLGDTLVLANRGNGAAAGALTPVDALMRVPLGAFLAHLEGGALPPLAAPEPFALGEAFGVRLTFTDLCARRGALYFLASAEASPNAIDDGAVVGTVLGRIDGGTARWAPIVDERGQPSVAKVEGLAWAAPDGEGDEVLVVVDRDDPDRASELLRIAVPRELL